MLNLNVFACWENFNLRWWLVSQIPNNLHLNGIEKFIMCVWTILQSSSNFTSEK